MVYIDESIDLYENNINVLNFSVPTSELIIQFTDYFREYWCNIKCVIFDLNTEIGIGGCNVSFGLQQTSVQWKYFFNRIYKLNKNTYHECSEEILSFELDEYGQNAKDMSLELTIYTLNFRSRDSAPKCARPLQSDYHYTETSTRVHSTDSIYQVKQSSQKSTIKYLTSGTTRNIRKTNTNPSTTIENTTFWSTNKPKDSKKSASLASIKTMGTYSTDSNWTTKKLRLSSSSEEEHQTILLSSVSTNTIRLTNRTQRIKMRETIIYNFVRAIYSTESVKSVTTKLFGSNITSQRFKTDKTILTRLNNTEYFVETFTSASTNIIETNLTNMNQTRLNKNYSPTTMIWIINFTIMAFVVSFLIGLFAKRRNKEDEEHAEDN
ncbi:hypothetical protein RF11_12263 [Thelohanellus kitauei]|uniref:Uncharacterized protein n=1 Tax=Thelohanellus kitauei TaxID=669202 RepID=A0A0C2MZG7_THEKT|nr:hypothetical protein RF11_12263 [Thelohanellus kitauei]